MCIITEKTALQQMIQLVSANWMGLCHAGELRMRMNYEPGRYQTWGQTRRGKLKNI